MNYNFSGKVKSLFNSSPIIQKVLAAIVGSAAWLIDAIGLDVYRSKSKRLRHLVNELYDEIARATPISSPDRTREVIKTVLINLWIGAYVRKPIRYYRDRSKYTSARRYGQIFLKYDRLLPVIDTMEALGYLEQKIGFRVFDKEFGFQTRMWATDKLIARFEKAGLTEPGFFTNTHPKEVIVLKDTTGRRVQYIDTPAIIRRRRQLVEYNNRIDNSDITVALNREVMVSFRFLLLFLYQYVIKGKVKILTIKPTTPSTSGEYIYNPGTIQHYTALLNIPIPMTQKELGKQAPIATITDPTSTGLFMAFLGDINTFARGFSDKDHAESFLSQECQLQDFGIDRLEFQLMDEELHRVYNGSFKYGGRFYGALHQSLPRELRPFIRINGQKTCEPDYSAHHLKMLYHLEGIDSRRDPYLACEGQAMRKHYKSVALIAINAANTRDASGAIYDEFKDNGLMLPQRPKPIKSMMETFKATHAPIRRHLFSGAGLTLQNKDSDIMNAILVRLMDMDIIGLPVHDSVIVQTQHRDTLKAIMEEEYEKQMGFKPVVDAK